MAYDFGELDEKLFAMEEDEQTDGDDTDLDVDGDDEELDPADLPDEEEE